MSRKETITIECDRCHDKVDLPPPSSMSHLAPPLGWASIMFERIHSGRDIDPTLPEEAVAQTTLHGHACPECAPLILAIIEGR